MLSIQWQNPIAYPLQLRTNRRVLRPSCIAASLLPSTTSPSSSREPACEPSTSTTASLFLRYGFSDDHIDSIFHKQPRIIDWPPERVERRLDCFVSFGFSPSELTTLVSLDPQLLLTSESRYIDNLNFLEKILGSKKLVKRAIARSSRVLKVDLKKKILPNVEYLKSHCVSPDSIAQAISRFPTVMLDKSSEINAVVDELKALGMDPASKAFILAIYAKLRTNKEKWDEKLALYRSLGWSDESSLAAFRKHPYCMITTGRKIKKMMRFYMEKLGWSPVFLSQRPVFIDLSLETRIIPRCAVLEVLASRQLLEKDTSLYRLFVVHESLFNAKFVSKYIDSIPEVIKAYKTTEPADNYPELKLWQERTKQLPVLAEKLQC